MRKNTIRKLVEEKRTEILRVVEKYGATNLRIFGSAARGEDKEDSDVDFLVDLPKGTSLLDHASLIVDLEDLLGIKVDVLTEKNLKDGMKAEILKEAVLL